jgi:hypothetical protein
MRSAKLSQSHQAIHDRAPDARGAHHVAVARDQVAGHDRHTYSGTPAG